MNNEVGEVPHINPDPVGAFGHKIDELTSEVIQLRLNQNLKIIT